MRVKVYYFYKSNKICEDKIRLNLGDFRSINFKI